MKATDVDTAQDVQLTLLPAFVGLSGLLGQTLGLVNGIGLEASIYR